MSALPLADDGFLRGPSQGDGARHLPRRTPSRIFEQMTSEPRKNGTRAPRILIVNDDPGQRSLLDSFLRGQGFETVPVASGEEALETLRTGAFSMMISDVRMPGLSGLETLRRARQEHAVLPILLVTAYADIREAVGAMRDGALNYLAKPIDLDELLASVRQATGLAKSAPRKFNAERQLPPGVVAESPLMQAVFDDASLVAPSESRVLITGESGVGKEVLADVIHAWSPRASGPIVKVNCAAIPENLLESELFGHEKGAFTGAIKQKPGRFEAANGGTIFLDEIADMSPPLQAKLLRVTQEGRFNRIGSNDEIHTNARILAATNRQLDEEVKARPLPRRPLLPAERGGDRTSRRCASARRTSWRWPARSSPNLPRGRRVFLPRSPMAYSLPLAGKRAPTAQRDGTRRAALPWRTHPAPNTCPPRSAPAAEPAPVRPTR